MELQSEIMEVRSKFSDTKSMRSSKTTITEVEIENLRVQLSEASIKLEKKKKEN
jgi:hypothetical protein